MSGDGAEDLGQKSQDSTSAKGPRPGMMSGLARLRASCHSPGGWFPVCLRLSVQGKELREREKAALKTLVHKLDTAVPETLSSNF